MNHLLTMSVWIQPLILRKSDLQTLRFETSANTVFGASISLFLDLRQRLPISQETCVPTMQNTIELLALKPNIPQG